MAKILSAVDLMNQGDRALIIQGVLVEVVCADPCCFAMSSIVFFSNGRFCPYRWECDHAKAMPSSIALLAHFNQARRLYGITMPPVKGANPFDA